ncbi:MAG: hypothetical protein RL136_2600, partial [Planctomycetota bacterium]
ADQDGFGAGAMVACNGVSTDTDCNDSDALVFPGAEELCSNLGVDNDCDGDNTEAEATDRSTFYADADNDGAGDPNDSVVACSAPAGYVAVAGDECPADGGKTEPGTCGCGVPDTDTDADGLADCIDNCPSIANADQLDCNANGVGDVCELADGSATDCNENAVLDSCDLASGTSTDIDGSGAPDECELVVGGSGFATIQQAIDAAPEGSVIKVGPGTHAPFSAIGRGLTVESIAGDELTAIDGLGQSRCVEISGSTATRFTLRGFTIRNGVATEGAGLRITDSDPVIENCVFTQNTATGSGGAIHAVNSAADILLTTFTGNAATTGGAISLAGATGAGTAMHISSSLFIENSSAQDGGAIVSSGALFLLECTLEQNIAGGIGGGVKQLETGELTLFTSRFCRNEPDNISGAFTAVGDNILSQDCNGNGVCDADEIADGTVLDCNGNGFPDTCDISGGTEGDCNSNGIPDSCDIADGSSSDVDENGIPDECKPDCNANGIPDAYEIATGGASDCNANGIPDSCDIAAGNEADCNANGAIDSCELADGSATDCDDNGLIDACDIASGAADADSDGRLDRCERAHGDLNLDGLVNALDLGIVLATWGEANGGGDANGDGTVDATDLALVLTWWGLTP